MLDLTYKLELQLVKRKQERLRKNTVQELQLAKRKREKPRKNSVQGTTFII